MKNQKTLLDRGYVIEEQFNAFFARKAPKQYVWKGKHNPITKSSAMTSAIAHVVRHWGT